MLDAAEHCWRVAGGLGDRGLKIAAAGMLGLADYSTGHVPQPRDRAGEARRMLDSGHPDRDGTRLEAYDWLGWLEVSIEEHHHAIAHFECGLEIGRRTGAGHLLITMSFGLVLGCVWSGRLKEAIEYSREHAGARPAIGQPTGERVAMACARSSTFVPARSTRPSRTGSRRWRWRVSSP